MDALTTELIKLGIAGVVIVASWLVIRELWNELKLSQTARIAEKEAAFSSVTRALDTVDKAIDALQTRRRT